MTDTSRTIPLERTANSPVTEGIHPFRIVAAEDGEGAKGPYWQFTCACLTPGEEGKTTRMFLSLTPQSRWRLEIFLDAIRAPASGSATIDKFLNRTFRGTIVHQDYEGRPQARITEMFPYDASASVPAPAPSTAGVKVVRKAAAEAPAPTPNTSKGLPADATGDDEAIPF